MDNSLAVFPDKIGHVYALGLTYRAHIEEVGAKEREPMMFAKHCPVTVGDGELPLPSEDALWQALTKQNSTLAQTLKDKLGFMPLMLDYEVELGIYLLESVCQEQLDDKNWMPKVGIFLANDVSARSLQICGEMASSASERMEYWTLSKSLPGFLPVAKGIYYPDSLSPDHFPDIELSLTVNGEERQRDNCQNIIYSPKLMLQYALNASKESRLEVGDCLLTGTPAGVALRLTPFKKFMAKVLPASLRVKLGLKGGAKEPNYLKSGDSITIHGGLLGQQTLTVGSASP